MGRKSISSAVTFCYFLPVSHDYTYISLWCRVVQSAARIRYRSTRENSTKIATQHAGNHIVEASAISIRDRTRRQQT